MRKKILSQPLLFFLCATNLCNAQSSLIDSLLHSLKSVKEDTNKVNILYQLSDASEEDSAVMNYAQQALELAQKLNYQKGIADAYNNIGYVYNQKGEISTAYEYYQRSLKIREETGDKNGMAPLLNNIAAVFERQGNISSALEYYQKSLKIREEINDSAGIAKLYNNIGLLYKSQNDFEHAYENLSKSLQINEARKDSNGIALSLINVGFIYQGMGDISKSNEFFERSYNLYKSISGKKGVASSLYNIGLNYASENKFDTALNYYNQSLSIIEELDDKVTLAAVLNNIGKIHFEKKDYKQAENFCLKSFNISNAIGVPERISYASESLSKIYSAEGKYKEALQMHILYKQMADSISNQETRKSTIRNQMQYDFDKKESLLKAEQDKKDALAKAEIKRQTLIRNSTLGGVGLAGIFSFLLIRSFNRRRKTAFEREVTMVEMKALRAQMNPHFIFNSLHSINKFVMDNDKLHASSYLSDFAKLMRLILENSREQEVTLEKDLAALELYMQLESLRFQNRFRFSIEVDDELDREITLIPPLLLQPFVENSILHGLQTKDDGFIKIKIAKEDKMIRCMVDDNGIGIEQKVEDESGEKKKRASLGMKITKERLEIINQQKKVQTEINIVDLKDADGNPCGLRIEILLPLEEAF